MNVGQCVDSRINRHINWKRVLGMCHSSCTTQFIPNVPTFKSALGSTWVLDLLACTPETGLHRILHSQGTDRCKVTVTLTFDHPNLSSSSLSPGGCSCQIWRNSCEALLRYCIYNNGTETWKHNSSSYGYCLHKDIIVTENFSLCSSFKQIFKDLYICLLRHGAQYMQRVGHFTAY